MDPKASNPSHLPNYPLARHPLGSFLREVFHKLQTMVPDRSLLVRHPPKGCLVALQLVELLNSLQWAKSPRCPRRQYQGK